MTKRVLILRTCSADMTAHGGFKWPKRGPVTAPDWDPKPECGNGLHGYLWGEGSGTYHSNDSNAKWLVVSTDGAGVVDLEDKVKFAKGYVVYCGDQSGATDYILTRRPGAVVIGAVVAAGKVGTATTGDYGTAIAGDYGTAIAGDYGTATAGYRGTATAGYRGKAIAGDYGAATTGDKGTATAGDYGTATSGDYGTATADYRGKAIAGDYGTAIAGYRGTVTAGDRGTVTAGYRGTVTAGDRGTVTAGDRGTATAGDYGTAIAGDYGTAIAGSHGIATAGHGGTIIITYHVSGRKRLTVGYVGEDGIKANTAYLVINGRLEKA